MIHDTAPDMTMHMFIQCDSAYHRVRESFTIRILVSEDMTKAILTLEDEGEGINSFEVPIDPGVTPLLSKILDYAAYASPAEQALSLPEQAASA